MAGSHEVRPRFAPATAKQTTVVGRPATAPGELGELDDAVAPDIVNLIAESTATPGATSTVNPDGSLGVPPGESETKAHADAYIYDEGSSKATVKATSQPGAEFVAGDLVIGEGWGTSAASGTAQQALELDITLETKPWSDQSVASGRNEARVAPGVNPFVVAQHVDATVQVNGDYSTSAVAKGEKVRTILMEDQERDNETFDFGIKELVLTVAGQSAPTFASVEFQLWNDTNNDGVEDTGGMVWDANARFELVYNWTLGLYEGSISAGGAWCECDFLVAPPTNAGVPGVVFTATLRPESKLQYADVDPTQDYIFVSKYRAEATGGDPAVPASAGVYYEKCYAPPIKPKLPDMDAATVKLNAAVGELDEAKEESTGAFLPLNGDDDNYDAANTGDKDESGAIAGENDLLPITLKALPADMGGTYTLTIPTNVKVWTNADRSGAVTSGSTTFDATKETTVYVEGVTKASDTLKLNWSDGTRTMNDADRIKLTVFEMTGPLNVPGRSIYNYQASGALADSGWTDAVGGKIVTQASPSDANILWGPGPYVGHPTYTVNPDYIWGMDVNVVAMRFATMGNNATYASRILQPPSQVNGPGTALISAASSGNAMAAQIVLKSVEGPTVNGVQRGRKFMEVGHVHQETMVNKHGLYNNSTPKKRRQSSLQDGNWHWDAATASTLPWTFKNSQHYLLVSQDNQVVNNHLFSTFDNPTLLFTDAFTLNGDQVDQTRLLMQHRTYIAVRTTAPDINGSAAVLTQRAALNWQSDASGDIDAAGHYQPTGTGVTGDPRYAEVTTGDRVPTAATNLNETFAGETWSTENQ